MNKISIRASAFAALAISAQLALSTAGCKPAVKAASESRMGDPAVAGALTFNVVESRWQSQLDSFPTPRMPQRNFLLLKITVTNSGSEEKSIPFLKVENSAGDSFSELENGSGLDGWLGVFRRVGPAQTEEGWILFDVPTNSYRLRISDGSVENEQVAYISIPLNMQTDTGLTKMP